MSKTLKALGIAAICVGSIVTTGVTIVRASDHAKGEQEAQVRSKIEADNEFSRTVQFFNTLMDQQWFSEAEELADQARLLYPENPLSDAMYYKAKVAALDWGKQQNRTEDDNAQAGRLMFGVGDDNRGWLEQILRPRRNSVQLREEHFELLLRSGSTTAAKRKAFGQIAKKLKGEVAELETSDKKGDAARTRQMIQTLEAAATPPAILIREVGHPRHTYFMMQTLELRCLQSHLDRLNEHLKQLGARRDQLRKTKRFAESEVLEREIVIRRKDLSRKSVPRVFYYIITRGFDTAEASERVQSAYSRRTSGICVRSIG
jgi:hypothetical protein